RSRVRVPSLPLFTHRFCRGFLWGSLEVGRKRLFGLDGDDGLGVEPDGVEDEVQELVSGFVVVFVLPEELEVGEDAFGGGEVGKRLWGEAGEFVLQGLSAAEVFGSGEVAEFVQVADAVEALFEGGAAAFGFFGVGPV